MVQMRISINVLIFHRRTMTIRHVILNMPGKTRRYGNGTNVVCDEPPCSTVSPKQERGEGRHIAATCGGQTRAASAQRLEEFEQSDVSQLVWCCYCQADLRFLGQLSVWLKKGFKKEFIEQLLSGLSHMYAHFVYIILVSQSG